MIRIFLISVLLPCAARAAGAPMATFEGKYGEIVQYPAKYAVESEMHKSIEIVRFSPAGAKVDKSAFNVQQNYDKLDLMQLLIIPKAGSKVRSIDEVRAKKEAEFRAGGLNFWIKPAKSFLPGSIFVRVYEPYRQVHAYIEGTHYFFSVLGGRLGPLFKSVVDGLVQTSRELPGQTIAEPERPTPATDDPEEFAKLSVLNHRFRLTEQAAEELGLPRVSTVESYLKAAAAALEREYEVGSERTWEVEKVRDDLYRVKYRVKMLQEKFFKKKVKYAWHVDIRTHEITGLNERSRVFFFPETQVD